MMNLLRRLFARATLEERREMDLEEAEFMLLDACKQVEYHAAIVEAMKIRRERLQQLPQGVL